MATATNQRAKILLKGLELTKLLEKHSTSLLKIQDVAKTNQEVLETILEKLLLEMWQKTSRMSHKVINTAMEATKIKSNNKADLSLSLSRSSQPGMPMDKLKYQKTGARLSKLQSKFSNNKIPY